MKRISSRPLLLAVLLSLVLIPSVPGQEVPLDLKGGGVKDVETVVMVPKVVIVKTVQSFPFQLTAPTGAGLYFWSYPAGVTATDKGEVLEITGAPKGNVTVSVKLIGAKLDKEGRFVGFDTRFGSLTFSVGDVPTPVPPGPEPGPDPPPGPVTGLRVVLVRETGDTMTKEQLNIFHSPKVAAYLDAKCKDGKKGWRRWDKDQNVANETEVFRKLWEATKPALGTLPAIVIVTDQKGEVFPLPATEEATLNLLKKYGG